MNLNPPIVRYHSHVVYCCCCEEPIVDGDYWLKDGCPIVKAKDQGNCSCASFPIHVHCLIEIHLLKRDCTSLESWLVLPTNTTRKVCYYWHPTPPVVDTMRILACPLQCGSYHEGKSLKSHEYIEMRCWIDRHLPVCEKLCKLKQKTIGSSSMIASDLTPNDGLNH